MYVYMTIILLYCAVYIITPRKYIGWLFVAFVAAMTVMAYYTVPAELDDLSRYYRSLEYIRDMSLKEFLVVLEEPQWFWSGMPTCGFYFYFISKLQLNGFFPAITILLSYGSICLMLYKTAERYNIGKWYLFLGSILLFITFAFHGLVSGIRNGLTATIFCLCIYYELFEKKNKVLCWIGYIACIGMHASGIIMFLLMLAEVPNRKKNWLWYTIICGILVAMSSTLLQILGEHTDIQFFKTMAFKEDSYANGNFEYGLGYYAKLVRFAVLAAYSVYCLQYIKKAGRYEEIAQFISYSLILTTYTTFVIPNEIYYSRIVGWAVPIMGSLVTMIGLSSQYDIREKEENDKKKESIVRHLTVLHTNELILNLVLIASILLLGWVVFFKSSLLTYVVGRSIQR